MNICCPTEALGKSSNELVVTVGKSDNFRCPKEASGKSNTKLVDTKNKSEQKLVAKDKSIISYINK